MPDERPDVPAFIAWTSRHGGAILFGLLLTVAMIEAVALFAAKRSAATASSPNGAIVAPTPAGEAPEE